jgi:hypothetical protein
MGFVDGANDQVGRRFTVARLADQIADRMRLGRDSKQKAIAICGELTDGRIEDRWRPT